MTVKRNLQAFIIDVSVVCVLPLEVYPRACGGTALLVADFSFLNGLSPRVRGNFHDSEAGQLWGRSIPARAGELRGLPLSRLAPGLAVSGRRRFR